jgi:FkbM family methyltransferase
MPCSWKMIDGRNRPTNLLRIGILMARGFRSPRKIARRLKLLPLAARFVRNWPQFMFHYSLGLVPDFPYILRNGARIQIGRGVNHVPIIEIFMRHDYGTIPDGATVLDLGANIGTFSIYAAITAHGATIYSYEPAPQYFQLLHHNVRLNGVERQVRCFDLALADSEGSRDLIIEPGGRPFPSLVQHDGDSGSSVRVPCTTLAEIMTANGIERIDLLKMDCEGAEYEILFGTSPDVLAKIVEIRMEIHNLGIEGCEPARLKDYLQSRDFVITRDEPFSPSEGTLWVRRHDPS